MIIMDNGESPLVIIMIEMSLAIMVDKMSMVVMMLLLQLHFHVLIAKVYIYSRYMKTRFDDNYYKYQYKYQYKYKYKYKRTSRWGLMTITTVGNDLHPKTLLGKLIGGFCALSGVRIATDAKVKTNTKTITWANTMTIQRLCRDS